MNISIFSKSKVRFIALFLCFSLCFSLVALPSVQPPAHAEAAALFTVDGIAVALVILAACGITFSNTAVGRKCIEQWGIDVPDVPTLINFITAQSTEGHILRITALSLPKVKQLVREAVEYFKGKESVRVENTDVWSYQNHVVYDYSKLPADLTFKQLFDIAPYYSTETTTFILNGVNYNYTVSSGNYCWVQLNGENSNESNSGYGVYFDGRALTNIVVKYGFVRTTNNVINPFIVGVGVGSNGELQYNGTIFGSQSLYVGSFPYASETLIHALIDVPVKAATEIADTVNDAIGHAVGSLNEGIQADIQKVIDAINQGIAADDVASKEDAQELLGIREYIEALEGEQERILEAIEEANQSQFRPSATLPTFGSIWGHVTDFLQNALIWMQLWLTGFVQLPSPLQSLLWALLVITIIIGLMGVLLK